MKRLVTAIVLLILILCISCYSLFAVQRSVGEVSGLANEIRYETESADLTAKSQELFDLWNEKEKLLVIFLRHDTLDELTVLLAELPSLARYEEYGSFYSRVDTVLARLDDLLDSVKPNYRNLM